MAHFVVFYFLCLLLRIKITIFAINFFCMRHKRNIEALSEEFRKNLEKEYASVFSLPMWTLRRDSVRKVRPYTTADFKREFFIPDL